MELLVEKEMLARLFALAILKVMKCGVLINNFDIYNVAPVQVLKNFQTSFNIYKHLKSHRSLILPLFII
jgi:hypothetical protein